MKYMFLNWKTSLKKMEMSFSVVLVPDCLADCIEKQ